tara:strand:- start:283 stop:555 length:273 start_codon:yes stop_codon:yes gene_type:complete
MRPGEFGTGVTTIRRSVRLARTLSTSGSAARARSIVATQPPHRMVGADKVTVSEGVELMAAVAGTGETQGFVYQLLMSRASSLLDLDQFG